MSSSRIGTALLVFVAGLACGIALTSPRRAARAAAVPPQAAPVECRRADGPITLDGRLDEPAWARAEKVNRFMRGNRPAKTATTIRLLWDDQYLYFGGELEDHDLYADVKQRNGVTWDNDVIELFLKPSEQKLAYYEFQVTPANTPLELFFPSRGAGGWKRFAPITRLGMQSKVRLDGTLNDWRDRDKGWTAEVRIPWSAFAITGGAPKAGDTWRFASCRYDYSVDFDQPEESSCAPLPGSFHQYENYLPLKFVR